VSSYYYDNDIYETLLGNRVWIISKRMLMEKNGSNYNKINSQARNTVTEKIINFLSNHGL